MGRPPLPPRTPVAELLCAHLRDWTRTEVFRELRALACPVTRAAVFSWFRGTRVPQGHHLEVLVNDVLELEDDVRARLYTLIATRTPSDRPSPDAHRALPGQVQLPFEGRQELNTHSGNCGCRAR